jgi:hypothetical protein
MDDTARRATEPDSAAAFLPVADAPSGKGYAVGHRIP